MIDIHHDDASLRTFILFVQTADAVLKYSDAHFYKKARLSSIKYTTLRILAVNGGTMTPSEIARWTLREKHNITTLIDRLERDELIVTERSKKDRRSINVILTDKGREVLDQAIPVARDIVNQVMSSTSKNDVVELEKLLGVLRQNAHAGLERVAEG